MESPNFLYLPSYLDLKASLNKLGYTDIKNISLFQYSSCSPTYHFQARNKNFNNNKLKKYVLRSSPHYQPHFLFDIDSNLLDEIKVISLLEKNNINVPKIYSNGVNSFYINKSKKFDFFISSYVEGIAVDKYMKDLSIKNKMIILRKIAKIYLTVHKQKKTRFSTISNSKKEVYRSYAKYFYFYNLKIYKELKKEFNLEVAKKYKKFIDLNGLNLINKIQKSGYKFEPTLTLYDASAGNMLIRNKKISLIDFSTAAYAEKIMDFTSMFFVLRNIFIKNFKKNNIFEYFFEYYKRNGGDLPNKENFLDLLRIHLVNHFIKTSIYFKNHNNKKKDLKHKKFLRLAFALTKQPHLNEYELVKIINIYN